MPLHAAQYGKEITPPTTEGTITLENIHFLMFSSLITCAPTLFPDTFSCRSSTPNSRVTERKKKLSHNDISVHPFCFSLIFTGNS